MATIVTAGLTAMQIGRLEKALDKPYRIDGEIETLRQLVEELPAYPVKRIFSGMIDWNRRHFNSLDAAGQRAYEERLRKKRYYALDSTMDPLDGSLIVPKIVWDAVEERQK